MIPVKADLSEFTRQFDDALEAISRKMGEAADAAAKGFKDKMLAALDEVSQRLDPLIEKAGAMRMDSAPQGQSDTKQEKDGLSDLTLEVRSISGKVEDVETALRRIDGNVTVIASKVGNLR